MNYLYKIGFTALLFIAASLDAKVNIFAHYFGQPEFVKYQHTFFQKNLLDDYEFIIFEDSPNPAVSAQIKSECEKYGVAYIHIPRSEFDTPKFLPGSSYVGLHSPSFECAVATQYIYDNYVVSSNDICLILDNDIFLIAPFSIENYIGSNAFAYRIQERANSIASVTYMLPNFIFFNPPFMSEKESLSFNMGTIAGVNTDTGGYTYYYLQDHKSEGKELPIYYLYEESTAFKDRHIEHCPLLFTSQEWSSHSFIENDLFLHLRMGSNWSSHPHYKQIKTEIETLFEALLSQ